MRHFVKKEVIKTREHTQIHDITERVIEVVENSGMKEGHMVIQPLHTTVGIYLNESEERLHKDMIMHLGNNAPQLKGRYLHDDISQRDCPDDEPENGHSHIKSAFYSNPSLSLVLIGGKLQLGTYQRVLFAEFDGPCPRKHKSARSYLVSILGR
jgi:secondary thiamine-phosphate synthase enzyme